jgi:hypothetical protein
MLPELADSSKLPPCMIANRMNSVGLIITCLTKGWMTKCTDGLRLCRISGAGTKNIVEKTRNVCV